MGRQSHLQWDRVILEHEWLRFQIVVLVLAHPLLLSGKDTLKICRESVGKCLGLGSLGAEPETEIWVHGT